MEFEVGNNVTSECKYSLGMKGIVIKVTDKAVHVKFEDGNFQKFHFNPTHHMQTPIQKLKKPCK